MADYDLARLSAPFEAVRGDVKTAYERLDAEWEAVAKQLRKLPIPCTVGHRFAGDEHTRERLEWRKWKGKKRLCLVSYWDVIVDDEPDESFEVVPYEEWGGEQRKNMRRYIPNLFADALKQTKEFIADVQE